jgi:hypothetical protein
MSQTDSTNPGLFDDLPFPFIDDDFDWDEFFNFEPQTNNASLSLQDVSLTQWEPLNSAPQHQPLSHTPAIGPGTPTSMVTEANLPPVESSAFRQVTTNSNAIEESQNKRGIQDFLSSFFANESSVPPQSKRQAFSPDRRTEVAKVRKMKACQRCKMRKLSASLRLTRMSKYRLLTIN